MLGKAAVKKKTWAQTNVWMREDEEEKGEVEEVEGEGGRRRAEEEGEEKEERCLVCITNEALISMERSKLVHMQ